MRDDAVDDGGQLPTLTDEDRRQAEHDRRVLLTSTRLSGERRQDDPKRRRIAENVKENAKASGGE